MRVGNRREPMRVGGIKITTDDIPFVSSITNSYYLLAKIGRQFKKTLYPMINQAYPKAALRVNKWEWLEGRSSFRCAVLLLPFFGNILVRLFDFAKNRQIKAERKEKREKNEQKIEAVKSQLSQVSEGGLSPRASEQIMNEVKGLLQNFFADIQNFYFDTASLLDVVSPNQLQTLFDGLKEDQQVVFLEAFQRTLPSLSFQERHIEALRRLFIKDAAGRSLSFGGESILARFQLGTLILNNGTLLHSFIDKKLELIKSSKSQKEKKELAGQLRETINPVLQKMGEDSSRLALSLALSQKIVGLP